MTCKQIPQLTPEQMAEFLMNGYSDNVPEAMRNEYRKRNLELFEEIHEPEYAAAVRKILETKYRKKRNAATTKSRK